MSPAVLALVLVVAFLGMALVLNHARARLALVELALNEGLPPDHQVSTHAAPPTTADLAALLGPGIHVFLSRNCHACQRLVDEFEQTFMTVDAAMHLRYVDRPRPIAGKAAETVGAQLHTQQMELAGQAGAGRLPDTVASGAHGLGARTVTQAVPQVMVTARDAGIAIDTVSRS